MHIKIETNVSPKALGPYSQAVKAGNMVFVSGQLPADHTTGSMIEGTIGELTHKTIDNLEAILTEAGMTLDHVVSVQVFLTDINTDFMPMNEAYMKRFKSSVPPARTTVEVSKLPRNSKIEIACIAHFF